VTAPVVAPDGGAAFVPDGDGIAAVRLADGRVLWRSDAARRPLVARRDRLVAERDRRIVVLDTANGAPVSSSDPLPEFDELAARAEGDRALVQWRGRYRGGAAPPPHVREAAERTGALAVDLATGATAPAEPRPHTPDPLTWELDDGGQTLYINGAPIARGRGLVAELTPDGRHVFVRDEDRWRVFDTDTGQAEATLTYEPGARDPAIEGPRAYYRVPGALVARDLATDAVAWRLPLSEKPPIAAPRLRQ
jgi:hypothetical protein